MSNSKFTVTAGGSSVPAGSYSASFVGLEPYTENEQYGEGIKLNFEIAGGDHDGETASRIVSRKFSPKSNLYRFAKAFAGRDLETGEDFDFADFEGVSGMLIVEEVDNGTRVSTFLKAAEEESPKKSRSRSRK